MRRILMSDTATEVAQDIQDRVEEAIYPSEVEPLIDDNEGVLEDAEELPKDGDPDLDEEEGSEDDLEDIAAEDLTLAAYLGIDDDRLITDENGIVSINAIIDGEKTAVPLKDLVANHQLQGHVNNKSMALEAERKEFIEKRNQAYSDLLKRSEGVSKLGELAEAELVSEYNSIDWNRLRTEDPGNFAAIRQEYSEKAQKIQQVKVLAEEEQARVASQRNQEMQENADAYNKYQFDQMISDNPEWAEDSVRIANLTEIKNFIQDYGFTEDEAMGVTDHRLLRIIKDAKSYKLGKKVAEKKRVGKALPKFQKPGAHQGNTASLSKARKVKSTIAKAKQTGKVQDVANAILDRM